MTNTPNGRIFSFQPTHQSGNETSTLTVAGSQLSMLVVCRYQWIVLREREGNGASGQGRRESVRGEGVRSMTRK